MRIPWALAALSCIVAPASAALTELRITGQPGQQRVQVLSAGEVIAESPAEGLWSIACEWQERWPAGWRHASPATTVTAGEWTILKGELSACGGTWLLEDAYRQKGNAIQGVRRFKWNGASPAPKVTLSVRFQAGADRSNLLLPGILYYGNPSGAGSGRVPVYKGAPGEEALFEEHRYPLPFAYVELERRAGLRGAALHSLPSPAPHANLPDQWWSLGVVARADGPELLLLSGPCASNGSRSVVKALQKGFVPYDNAYLNVPPGAVIEKTFFLEAFPVAQAGSGFSQAVRTAIQLSPAFSLDGLPEFADIVRAKYRYAKSRWYESGEVAGFKKYVDRNVFVMGWTGQAEAMGYALQVLEKGLGDPNATRMARKSLDFLATAAFYEGGFRNWYDFQKNQWYGQELLNQGQAMLAIARAIRIGRQRKLDTARWEAFLRQAADLHSRRILAEAWRPPSTAEAAFIAPLLECFALFKAPAYRQAAVKAAEHYARRHLSLQEPYWGGTLDARCEDKEAAALAFQAFLALYETTRNPEHLRWARHACDVVLTYVFTWDVDLPPGRLRDHAFRTRGWTVVSPQNQHLDVWGAVVAPDVYRLGQIDNRDDLKRLALVMYRTCGQLIDPSGSQGEQMQHTNYAQRNQPVNLAEARGGYNEQWTVFWITAHFLTGAARLAELGVPIW